VKVGVLALQGAVSEHCRALAACGARVEEVRTPAELAKMDGLVMPGGESTTLRHLLQNGGLWEPLLAWEKPILGTCAGAILLGRGSETLGRMAMELDRNAYGRQQESFEADVALEAGEPFPGIFIRAPVIIFTDDNCTPIAWHNGNIVGAVQPPHMALTFHPELTGDRRLHQRWLEMVSR